MRTHETRTKKPISPSLQKQMFGILEDVETSSDEEEDDNREYYEDSDDELDDEDRLLQRTILRNFLGRVKKTSFRATRPQVQIQEESDNNPAFSVRRGDDGFNTMTHSLLNFQDNNCLSTEQALVMTTN